MKNEFHSKTLIANVLKLMKLCVFSLHFVYVIVYDSKCL